MNILTKLLDVPSTDPEDARRRKLLNILLLGILAVNTAALIPFTIGFVFGFAGETQEVQLVYLGSIVLQAGMIITYLINRYRSGWVASALFLVLLELVFAVSDLPYEVANGRSLFLFAIPITMASVLMQPYASFLFATLTGIFISVISFQIDIVPNIAAIVGFYGIALVSWLSARSLERALIDLRAINRELDQRVVERTRDLAAALARVQAESSKNQAILESIADGVIVFDDHNQAIVANQASQYLLNYNIDQIAGQTVDNIMGAVADDEDRQTIINAVKNKELRRSGVKFEWGEKTLSVSFAAVQDEAEQATGSVVVFRDYTREAEVDRMKSAFVSMISHELRTPLNAIIGYGDMLTEEVYGTLGGEQEQTIKRMVANAKRMLGLVNNLLDQAQIEAGKLSISTSVFDIHTLIDEVEAVMSVLAEKKHLALECLVADDLPGQMVSDAYRLHQILVNLVGNAIKFTDEGSVTVRAYRPASDHWALEVKDTGTGIPPHAQTYIFDPFRQVDGSVTRDHSGTGLGLSIVQQLVKLLGGEITLDSEVGRGSTFTITLPLIPARSDAA